MFQFQKVVNTTFKKKQEKVSIIGSKFYLWANIRYSILRNGPKNDAERQAVLKDTGG